MFVVLKTVILFCILRTVIIHFIIISRCIIHFNTLEIIYLNSDLSKSTFPKISPGLELYLHFTVKIMLVFI